MTQRGSGPAAGAPTAVALVESPLQLLNAVEAAHAAVTPQLSGGLEIRWRSEVPGLARAAATIGAEALPRGVRLTPVARLRTGAGVGTASAYVLGDMLSGAGQATLLAARPGQVVLLDDGVATLRALDLLGADSASLVRVGGAGAARRRLGAAAHARLRRIAGRGGLTVFTALPVPERTRSRLAGIGVRVVDHRFAWVDSLGPTDPVPEPVVVIGSALVADGLIDPGPYLEWVRQVTDGAPARYFPHRRTDARVLGQIAALPGVVVEATAAPVELRLRGLRADQSVYCLPSSAFGLLSTLLRARGARVEGTPVPDSWWTPRARPDVRTQLSAALDLAACA